MSEKIIGYVLLVVGILVILGAGVSTFMVFTKQAEPVKLFEFSGISLDPTQMLGSSLPVELQTTLKQTNTSKQEMISGEMINSTSNIFAHLFLMGFIASIGYKLASLGTKLMRPIVVKLNEQKL